MKIACLRIDVDGFEGLRRGIRNIYNLIEYYGIKGTFFINLGKEANIIDFSRLILNKSSKVKKSSFYLKRRYTPLQNLRRLIFPMHLGKHFCRYLREISENENIEIEPHAWNHFAFTHFFPQIDIKKEIKMMIEMYRKCLFKDPIGYAPPSFNENKRLYNVLLDNGIRYISSRFGNGPYMINGLLQIPLSIKYSIEEVAVNNFSIYKTYIKNIGRLRFYSFYVHADGEGINEDLLATLEEVILRLKRNSYKFMTMEEIFHLYGKNHIRVQQNS